MKGKLLKGVLSFGIGLAALYSGSSVQAEMSTNQNDTLKVMTHNVYMLSTNLYPNWGQNERADLIGAADYIKNQDVVILNEVFDNSASNRLLGNLKKEYPNQTAVLGRSSGSEWDKTLGNYSSSTPEDGGVIVVNGQLLKRFNMYSKKAVDQITYQIKDLYTQKLRKMIVLYM